MADADEVSDVLFPNMLQLRWKDVGSELQSEIIKHPSQKDLAMWIVCRRCLSGRNGECRSAISDQKAKTAVVSPVGELRYKDDVITIDDFKIGALTQNLLCCFVDLLNYSYIFVDRMEKEMYD